MNQMQNKNNAGLRFSQKAVWRCILGLIIVIFGIFVYFLNQVDKTELVVRTGQTFEKAEVTEILQDNLEENGTRVGEQRVRVHMLTGVRKGEDLGTDLDRCVFRSGANAVSVDHQRDLYLRAHPSGGVVVLCDGT